MIEGNLGRVDFKKKATVVTYKVPPNYGGYINVFPDLVDLTEINKPVDLIEAHKLSKKYGDAIRIYPGSMELRNGDTYALQSRTVCVVGVGDEIQTAREKSLEGSRAIKGGSLWYRRDIGSKQHIRSSIEHLKKLRRIK